MQRILSTGGYKAMRKILLSLISVLALAALVACGGSSSNSVTIPSGPSTGNKAGFSTSSLKGTYVYTAGGATASNNFATVGVFTADGAGNITSGTLDYYDDGGNQIQNQSVTGTYSNGTTADVTSSATWTSSTASVASISSGGMATAVAAGSSTITASLSGVSSAAALTVTEPR